jgi:hypothetical protein
MGAAPRSVQVVAGVVQALVARLTFAPFAGQRHIVAAIGVRDHRM